MNAQNKTPNPMRGEGSVTLIIEGREVEYSLKATFTALLAIEKRVGRDLLSLLSAFGKASISLTNISIVFHELQLGAGGKLTYEQAGQLLCDSGFMHASVPILNCLGAAVMAGHGEADKGEGSPS